MGVDGPVGSTIGQAQGSRVRTAGRVVTVRICIGGKSVEHIDTDNGLTLVLSDGAKIRVEAPFQFAVRGSAPVAIDIVGLLPRRRISAHRGDRRHVTVCQIHPTWDLRPTGGNRAPSRSVDATVHADA